MNDHTVRRLTGGFGLAAGILILVASACYLGAGVPPPPGDAAKISEWTSNNSRLFLTGSLMDTLNATCFLVFLAGFRQLAKAARAEYEWVATLVLGVGLVYSGVTFTFDMLVGGAGLDAMTKPEPAAIRALGEGSALALSSVGLTIVSLFLASAAFVVNGTRILPRWLGWTGYVGAALNVVAIPTLYGGLDPTAFYSANGYAPLVLGVLPFTVWLLAAGASFLVVRSRAEAASTSVGSTARSMPSTSTPG